MDFSRTAAEICQSLARLPALAGSVHHAARQEADRPPDADRLPALAARASFAVEADSLLVGCRAVHAGIGRSADGRQEAHGGGRVPARLPGQDRRAGGRVKPRKRIALRHPRTTGLAAAARVLAAGGRVPKKFVKARRPAPAPRLEQRPLRQDHAGAPRRVRDPDAGRPRAKATATSCSTAPRIARAVRGRPQPRHRAGDGRAALADRARRAACGAFSQRPDQALAEPSRAGAAPGRVPASAHGPHPRARRAVSESVEMCRAAGQPHAAGMVNAILRKLASARSRSRRSLKPPPRSPSGSAIRCWLVERWVANYGRDAALAICEADQREPASGALFALGPDALPQIDDGSRLVAEIAAAALPPIAGRAPRVWDCCAAPGGKTLILAAHLAARQPAAEILATDISPRRLSAMQSRLRRYPFASAIRTEQADAAHLPPGEGLFDLILCDLPCSGTGTLGRNPEIRTRLQPAELARQAAPPARDPDRGAASSRARRAPRLLHLLAGARGK